jgi:hypothetical protein
MDHPIFPPAEVPDGNIAVIPQAEFEGRADWRTAVGGALVLHAGAHEVKRAQVYDVETPEPTKTWTPIPHGLLISLVTQSLIASGQQVTREAFALYRDGDRMFGVMEIANGVQHEDYSILVGLRNSHDQSFAAGLGLGAHVFVCDNQSFSADVQIKRPHTKNIVRDLPALVAKGIAMLSLKRGYQDKRIEAYKQFAIGNSVAHDIIIQALRARAINVQRVDDVVDQWYAPNHDEFAPRTAWSLFNGFTEALKGSGADLTPRTLRLHGLMDQVVGLPAFKSVIDVDDLDNIDPNSNN